jgi:pilus assembly protein CpaB
VSTAARRRRALVMLSLALASGGLAASQVRGRVREVERRVGPSVPVVVAAHELRPNARLRRRDLTVKEVPEAFAPRDSLASVAEAVGSRASVRLAAGSYLTAGQLGGGGERRRGGGLRGGERAVELAVAGGEALSGTGGPGSRVDVLVSSESRDGAGRTFLALEDVELLSLRPGGPGGAAEAPSGEGEAGAAASATATATLRVTLRQAVYLTAAQNFAREVRLLPRPAGDGRRSGRAAVSEGEL